ncbi:TRAP transporter small permease subunit [Pollutimonas sp. H1-120]|uniref:TRAP transporter small permease subunit n=1 Tax=Pollutimonas sp. H1-120 TaxID=3148824 RepID=UPI003B5174FA
MNLFIHFIGRVNEWVGRVAGLLILLVVAIIVREVIARSVFHSPALWADESMTYIAGFVYVLGGGYAMLHRRHVAVDMVYERFGRRGRRLCDLLAFALFTAYCFTLIWYGWNMAVSSFLQNETSGTLWNPPIWPVKFAIPIAGLLLFLQGVANLAENFRSSKA